MQLGSILGDDQGEACVTERVEFTFNRKTSTGLRKHKVAAIFLPVSVQDRATSRRAALAYLRSLPDYKEREEIGGERYVPPIPASVLEEECAYRFLAEALHDVDDSRVKFVGAADYGLFRDGVILEQVNWLHDVYKRYIAREYSELTPDLKALEDEAAKK